MEEHKKNEYRVYFIREEFLFVDIYANDEDQAYLIAKEVDYDEFEKGDCDLVFLNTDLLGKGG